MSHSFTSSIDIVDRDRASFVCEEIIDTSAESVVAIFGEEARTIETDRLEISGDRNGASSSGAERRQTRYWMPAREQLTPEASLLRYVMAVALPDRPIQDWEGLLQAISDALTERLLTEKQSYIEEILAMYWPPEFLETFAALEPKILHPTGLDLMPHAKARQILQAWAASLTLHSPAFQARLQRNATLSFPLEASSDPIAEEAQWAVEEIPLNEWLLMLLIEI